jgi:hypothetical protein
MDFLVLSLPEASYLYVGIAVQAMLRSSKLIALAYVIITISVFVLLWRGLGSVWFWKPVAGYLGTTGLILVLFWPEALRFGHLSARTTDATQIASYAASQDPDAEVVTAAETQLVPPSLQDPALVPVGFRLLLRMTTGLSLTIGRILNDQEHRTFGILTSMWWLLGVELTAPVSNAIQDWTLNCFTPIWTTTLEAQHAVTAHDLLPWDNSPVAQALNTREVRPGAQSGITWLQGSTPTATVKCDTYLAAVESDTQAWLRQLKSPRGTPLLQVFEEDLGLTPPQQARFLLYREILRTMQGPVPAPSLLATYAAIRGAGIAGKALDQGSFTGVVGLLTGTFSWTKTLFAAGRGAGAGVSAEFQRTVEGLSHYVGFAVLLTWVAPYVLGIANLVLVGLFPLLLLFLLIPGHQLEGLLLYFAILLFTMAAPLCYALVDVSQRLAGSLAPQSTDAVFGGLSNGATAFVWSTMATIVGLLVIPVTLAWLLFKTFRAASSLWRPGV